MSSRSSHTPWATVKRADDAEVVEVRGQRLAVALQPDDRLHLGLGDVGVQRHAVLVGEHRRRRG